MENNVTGNGLRYEGTDFKFILFVLCFYQWLIMYCHDHICYSANWCILSIACEEVLKGQFTQIGTYSLTYPSGIYPCRYCRNVCSSELTL